MNTTVCLTLVLLSAGAPVPKDVAPVGPAPYVLKTELGTDGLIRIFGVRQHPFASTADTVGTALTDLKGLTIYTVDGLEVSIKDATKKLAAGAPAVASSDGKKVDPDKRKSLKADTLIFVSPDLAKDRPNGTPTVIWEVTYGVPVPAIPVGKCDP